MMENAFLELVAISEWMLFNYSGLCDVLCILEVMQCLHLGKHYSCAVMHVKFHVSAAVKCVVVMAVPFRFRYTF